MQEPLLISNEIVELKEITHMICPFCSHHVAASWQVLRVNTTELGAIKGTLSDGVTTTTGSRSQTPNGSVAVSVQWLICQNTECREIVIGLSRKVYKPDGKLLGIPESWIACPKRVNPPALDPLIPESFRKDYNEAWSILDDSWRMSAVLSRRILSDLLEKYDGAKQRVLDERIKAFIDKPQHPSRLKENLQCLREMGNFGAHTQVQQKPPTPDPVILDVSKEEAEWTLKNVADLFDYFIVAPEKDKQLRASFNAKVVAAGRKPVT